jgi:hypothetical protein
MADKFNNTIDGTFDELGRDWFIQKFGWAGSESDDEIKAEMRHRAGQAGIFEDKNGILCTLNIAETV